MIHRQTHPVFVEGCFGCKAASIDFSAEATPNRRPAPVEIEATEKRWHKDHAAYERLYKQGYNPPRLDGCANRERFAKTKMDIEHPARQW